MIARIARKEFLEMTRDGRFRAAFGVVMVLLLASLALGWKHHRDVETQRREGQQAMRRQWLEQGEKNPHGAAHYGIYAFKPKSPLSMVDPGVDAYTGVSVTIEAHKRNDLKHRPARDATALARFGELSAAAVLQLLVPLLIIVLAFSAFAGERDRGTLRQLLSLGVPPRDLAIGKALGVAWALAVLLVPAAILGAAALGLASGFGGMADQAPGAAMMGAGYLLYFGAFVGISLAVSAVSGTSRTALLALLGFWIVGCLIVPRASADLASRLQPTPSALAFYRDVEEETRRGFNTDDPNSPALRELRETVLLRYGVDREEDLPISFAGIVLQESEEFGYGVYDKHFQKLRDVFNRQDRAQRVAAALSPYLAIRSLSMGAAGTNLARDRDFSDAVERYRRDLIKIMNDDITENAKGQDFGYIAGAELWEKVPEFRYEPPDSRASLAENRPDLIILAAWFLAASLAAALATARVRVS